MLAERAGEPDAPVALTPAEAEEHAPTLRPGWVRRPRARLRPPTRHRRAAPGLRPRPKARGGSVRRRPRSRTSRATAPGGGSPGDIATTPGRRRGRRVGRRRRRTRGRAPVGLSRCAGRSPSPGCRTRAAADARRDALPWSVEALDRFYYKIRGRRPARLARRRDPGRARRRPSRRAGRRRRAGAGRGGHRPRPALGPHGWAGPALVRARPPPGRRELARPPRLRVRGRPGRVRHRDRARARGLRRRRRHGARRRRTSPSNRPSSRPGAYLRRRDESSHCGSPPCSAAASIHRTRSGPLEVITRYYEGCSSRRRPHAHDAAPRRRPLLPGRIRLDAGGRGRAPGAVLAQGRADARRRWVVDHCLSGADEAVIEWTMYRTPSEGAGGSPPAARSGSPSPRAALSGDPLVPPAAPDTTELDGFPTRARRLDPRWG